MKADETLLHAALLGYQSQLTEIDQTIADIRRKLSGTSRTAGASAAETPAKKTRRKMSPAARKRIAAAQKKRWAEYKKQKDQS